VRTRRNGSGDGLGPAEIDVHGDATWSTLVHRLVRPWR
jgi:hypothetical protein